MARLTTKNRKRIPAAEFGLPKERKYPMPDKSHARDAKARASEERNRGLLSPTQEAEIDRKADRKLGKGYGAKRRAGKTHSRVGPR